LYGPQLVLLATLSAITIYRREISCNHVYAEEEEEENGANAIANDDAANRKTRTWNNQKTEDLLDGAGLYCSGSSLVPLILAMAKWFWEEEQQQQKMLQQESMEPKETAVSSLLSSKQNVSAGDLLELAGNFYCGEPIASLLLNKPFHIPSSFRKQLLLQPASKQQAQEEEQDVALGLPADTWIQIMSFLEATDVIAFGSTNRSCHTFVNGTTPQKEQPQRQDISQNDNHHLLWKTLWQRDYGWVLQRWNVGRRAAEQSLQFASAAVVQDSSFNLVPPQIDKTLYFQFGLGYLDYVLAGHNTMDSCLVGLQGHVYDLTPFLLSHPGSPETVMVHAGQDATDFFHRIGHSRGARKLAQSMCVMVNPGRLAVESTRRRIGLLPTALTDMEQGDHTSHLPPAPQPVSPPAERTMMAPTSSSSSPSSAVTNQHSSGTNKNQNSAASKPSAPTLQIVKQEYDQCRVHYQARAQRLCRNKSVVTQPNVYFDPFARKWKAWYMDENLQNVILHQLD